MYRLSLSSIACHDVAGLAGLLLGLESLVRTGSRQLQHRTLLKLKVMQVYRVHVRLTVKVTHSRC